MDRLDCLKALVETVRLGGMAAAARALRVSRDRVSRQIQALERELGVQLLVRTTRSLRLTEAGAVYVGPAREALAQLEDAAQRARDGQGVVRGVLRINAPMSFGVRRLAPLLPRFRAQHPEVELQVVLSDELIDPVQGGFDVTVRIADLPDSSMVARRIAPAPRALVASPGYLARHGVPGEPQALAAHALLQYNYLQNGGTWVLSRGADSRRVPIRSVLCANNGDVLLAAAEADMGITLLPRFIVDDALRAGRLRPVLPDWSAPPIAVHAVYPRARRLPLKSRRFIDFLVAELGED